MQICRDRNRDESWVRASSLGRDPRLRPSSADIISILVQGQGLNANFYPQLFSQSNNFSENKGSYKNKPGPEKSEE